MTTYGYEMGEVPPNGWEYLFYAALVIFLIILVVAGSCGAV